MRPERRRSGRVDRRAALIIAAAGALVLAGSWKVIHDLGAIFTLAENGSIHPKQLPAPPEFVALIQSASVRVTEPLAAPEVSFGELPLVGERDSTPLQVTAGEDLQQRASLAVKALLHWYDPATEYAEARQALAKIGRDVIPVLKKAVHEADHPGVRALAALELARLGVAKETRDGHPISRNPVTAPRFLRVPESGGDLNIT
jgi:hypothetical protein